MAPARVERSESGFGPVWVCARSGVVLIVALASLYGVTERVAVRDSVVTLNTHSPRARPLAPSRRGGHLDGFDHPPEPVDAAPPAAPPCSIR